LLREVINIKDFDLESLSLLKMVLNREVANELWVKAVSDDFSFADFCPLIAEK
jgi:hypothetical protein